MMMGIVIWLSGLTSFHNMTEPLTSGRRMNSEQYKVSGKEDVWLETCFKMGKWSRHWFYRLHQHIKQPHFQDLSSYLNPLLPQPPYPASRNFQSANQRKHYFHLGYNVLFIQLVCKLPGGYSLYGLCRYVRPKG